MVQLQDLTAYTNDLLEIQLYQDYCPNGLQVAGKKTVKKLVAGVSASQLLIDTAIAKGADAILVHHGYFWKGEDPCIVGMKKQRIAALLTSDVSLLAYHLPLDAHSEYGNNVQLAKVLGFSVLGSFGSGRGPEIALYGESPMSQSALVLSQHIEKRLKRLPLLISGGDHDVTKVAWCTGAAQGYIEAAVELGVDAFISGEVSEQTFHIAKEARIHFISAGHHATERYGAKALGEHLADKFNLEFDFIDIENPV